MDYFKEYMLILIVVLMLIGSAVVIAVHYNCNNNKDVSQPYKNCQCYNCE